MLAIADTSPTNYLVLLEHTALLPRLYTHIMLLQAVIDERLDPEAPVRRSAAHLPSWCEMKRSAVLSENETLGHLGAGEQEAITLAGELRADILLIDAEDGRRAALARALTVTGTLGVWERGAERALIDLPSTLARLSTTSFRVRDELVQVVLARDAARKRPM